ncbi:primase-helicase family protein [Treponema denticola]|uniref:primase-helicase family protein n=1 Tax=Treponema denticola TaxID=158 RepID=UPI003D911CF9
MEKNVEQVFEPDYGRYYTPRKGFDKKFIDETLFLESIQPILVQMADFLESKGRLDYDNLLLEFGDFLKQHPRDIWGETIIPKTTKDGQRIEYLEGKTSSALWTKNKSVIDTFIRRICNQRKIKEIQHKSSINKFLEAIFHLGVNWEPSTFHESCTALRIFFESIYNVLGFKDAQLQQSCIILEQLEYGGAGKSVLMDGIVSLFEKYGISSKSLTDINTQGTFVSDDAGAYHFLYNDDVDYETWKKRDIGLFKRQVSKGTYTFNKKYEHPGEIKSIATFMFGTNCDLPIGGDLRRYKKIRYLSRRVNPDGENSDTVQTLVPRNILETYFDCYPYLGNEGKFKENMLKWLEQAFLSCPFGVVFSTDIYQKRTNCLSTKFLKFGEYAEKFIASRKEAVYRNNTPTPTLDPVAYEEYIADPYGWLDNDPQTQKILGGNLSCVKWKDFCNSTGFKIVSSDGNTDEVRTLNYFKELRNEFKRVGYRISTSGKRPSQYELDFNIISQFTFDRGDNPYDGLEDDLDDQTQVIRAFDRTQKCTIAQENAKLKLQQGDNPSCKLPLEDTYYFASVPSDYDDTADRQFQETIKQSNVKNTPIEPERVDIPIVEDIKPIEPIIEVKSTIEDKPIEAINTPLIVDDTEAQQEPKTPLLPEREELNSFLKKYRLSVTTDFYNKKVYTQIEDDYKNYQFLITGYPKEGDTRKGNIIPTAFCYEMDCIKDTTREDREAFKQKQIAFIREKIAKKPDIQKHIASITFSGNQSVHILIPHNMGEEIKDDYGYYWEYIGRKFFKEDFDLFDKALKSPGHLSRTPNMMRIEDSGFEEIEKDKQIALIINGEIIDLTEVYKERQKELSNTSKSNSMLLRRITSPFKKLIKPKGTFKNPTNGNRGLKELEEMAKINPNLKEALEIYKNKDTSQGFNPVGIIQSLRQNSFSKAFVEKEIFPYMSNHPTNVTKDFNYYWHYNG